MRLVGTLKDVSPFHRLSDEGVHLLKRFEGLMLEVSNLRSGRYQQVESQDANALQTLSRRQRQILEMIARGMSSEQIAKRLSIATGTAISHRRELMRKLDLHSAAEVTLFAIKQKLIDD